jgi:hypothetical protein
MAEYITKADSDALSRLIQLQAGRHEIRLVWTGKGTTDLVALCNAHAVKARLSKHLWTALRDLMHIPELKELPEPLQAHIVSTILQAQALAELENEDHAQRMAALSKPKASA